MHTLLFGALAHQAALRGLGAAAHDSKRLFHKIQTIRLLNVQLQEPSRDGLDEAILSILTLGANEIETISSDKRGDPRPPFQSSLAGSQWLSVYGKIFFVKAHLVAIRSLVHVRGGLEKIALEGLAEILC